MRIVGIRAVAGWRRAEQERVYDLACWCEGECFVSGIAPTHQRIARAEYERRRYAEQAAIRQAAKDRVYAWRARKRAEREERRALARASHVAAVTVADSGVVTAYVAG